MAYAEPYSFKELFWWARDKPSSSAEIDFLISQGNMLVPIEVKAGTIGKMRSLKIFLEETKSPFGVRLAQNPLSMDKQVLSIPLYLIEQLPRLLKLMF